MEVITNKEGKVSEKIRKLLGLFGYVKIPKEAVQLSLLNESNLEKVHDAVPDGLKPLFKTMLDAQKALTGFLVSGRMVQ